MTVDIRLAGHDVPDLDTVTAIVNATIPEDPTSAKRATIGWAIENGLDALETGNDTDNISMRAVNARLGYRPMPDRVILRGTLDGGMIGR